MVEDESNAFISKHKGNRHENLYEDLRGIGIRETRPAKVNNFIEKNKQVNCAQKSSNRPATAISKEPAVKKAAVTADEKRITKAKNDLINKVVKTKQNEEIEGADEAEEMMLAFELLNKFKKDKNFIKKDIEAVKKQG
jgi:hypothetical protein